MRESQLAAVLKAMQRTNDTADRLALRDLAIDLTNQLNADLMATTMQEAAKVEGAAVTLEDAQLVDTLLGKGIMANGMNPELTTAQVGRTIAVLQHAMVRTMLGTLSHEETQILDQVFDQAAFGEHPGRVQEVRLVEARVRTGLGLGARGFGVQATQQVS